MAGVLTPEWLELEKALGARPILSGTIEDIIGQYNTLVAMLGEKMPPPDPSVTSYDKSLNDILKVRVYKPTAAREGDPKLPVCIYTHGGGYCCGDLDSEDLLCRLIAQHTPSIVVSVDYRLGPKHKMPSMIDDCMTAYEWAWKEADVLGGDPKKYFTAGGSAGGGLAVSIAERLITEGNGNRIHGIVAIVPVILHPSNIPEKFSAVYRSYTTNATNVPIIDKRTMDTFLDSINSDPKDPIQFPALSKSHSSYPPTYIATCGLDPLRDDGKVLELALKEAGVKVKRDHYEGYPHYFWIFPSITEGQKFVQNLLAGVQFVLGYK